MFICTTKFDIEEKELAFINQYLLMEEREVANKEKDAQAQDKLDPISDNEEDSVPIRNQPTTGMACQFNSNKRQRNTITASESEREEG
ncbi:hypothetical protein PHISCL_01949 [Aspergillus sclerotialis]|uniref:Uncharacterized protein n=1 Tax=Aspergillus sclerotialis TaxID=2070753 RepID=A0A3A2ZRN1_9EURO|nr:hypothetical protein PHISCL_01949 [Aspergillus sclerotialis]